MAIKFRIVEGAAFDKALVSICHAFGAIVERKRTLVHITVFNMDDIIIIRDVMTEVGSAYRGRYWI